MPDPGEGLVTRISDNEEPQFDNNRKYCERPVRKKDTMMHNIYNSPVPCNTDSDESDGDEMLPMGAFWPEPADEEWTVVERVHGGLRGSKAIDSDRLHNYGEKLDHPGMLCGQLDYIDETDNRGTRSEVKPSNRREATQYDNPPTGVEPATESATASVKPAICR